MLLTKPPMVKPEPLTVNPPPGPGVAVLFDAAGTISSSRSVLLLWLWLPRSTARPRRAGAPGGWRRCRRAGSRRRGRWRCGGSRRCHRDRLEDEALRGEGPLPERPAGHQLEDLPVAVLGVVDVGAVAAVPDVPLVDLVEVAAVGGVQGDRVAGVDVVPARREAVVVADEDETTLTRIVGVVVVTGPRAEDPPVGALGHHR